MEFIAVILIFISACLHITWNYFNKEGIKDTVSWIIICVVEVLVSCPFLFIYREYIPNLLPLWPLLLVSFFASAMQTWALNTAYRYGDYTVVYPVKNALPIVFTAIATFALGIGANVTIWGYMGYLLIILGCFLFPIQNFRNFSFKNYLNLGIIYTILAALGSCIYSIVDKEAMKLFLKSSPGLSSIGASLVYIPLLYICIAVFLIPFAIIDRYAFKIDFSNIKFKWTNIICVAVFSSAAYALVLIALTHAANAGYIVAFRQIGIPLSFIFGYFLLKEKIYIGKILGVIPIILGLIILACCK